MIFLSQRPTTLIAWLALRLGLAVDLPEDLLADLFVEPDLFADLQYGRD